MPENVIDELAALVDALLTEDHLRPVTMFLQDQAPTWYTDQASAAALDARRVADESGWGGEPTEPVFTSARDHPQWLRRRILAATLEWFLGRAVTCQHTPRARAPVPVFAASWKPGAIVCQECLHLLAPPLCSREYRTCASCGVTRETEDLLVGSGLIAGPVTYWFRVCERCRYWPKDAMS